MSFAMQSIRSWADGKHEVAIAVPVGDPRKNPEGVLAITSPMPSVINTLMRPGYGFAIIDARGSIWFHSDSEQIGQQNFLAETDFDTKIITAIKGRMGAWIQGFYFNKPHQFYLRPLNNLPLYLVTFYDLEYKDTPLILTVTITFVLLTFLFLIGGVQHFLQFISVYQYSRLKIKRFYLSWIRPRKFFNNTKAFENVKNVQTYLQSITLLSILFLGHLPFLSLKPSAYIAVCFLVLPAYIYLFQYFIFENVYLGEKWKRYLVQRKRPRHISSKSTFRRCRNIIRWLKVGTILRHPFFQLSLLLILLVNLALAPYIADFWIAVLAQLGYVFLFFTVLLSQSKRLRSLATREGFLRRPMMLYFTVIMLWLANASALPVIYLYQTAHCAEYATWSKYLSWKAASDDHLRHSKLTKDFQAFADPQAMERRGDYLSIWPGLTRIKKNKFSADTSNHDNSVRPRRITGNPIDSVEFLSVPPFTGLIASTQAVLGNSALDNQWAWYRHVHEDTVDFKYHSDRQPQYFSFPKVQSDLTHNEYALFLFLSLAALGWLVYRVTLFSIRHIFGLGIVLDYGFKAESDQKVLVSDLVSKEQGRYFIVGLPHSGKSEMLQEFLANKKNTLKIDLHNESPFLKGEELNFDFSLFNVIVLRHFEHAITDPDWNRRKLNLFIKLSSLTTNIIIVVSTVQPTSILDFYQHAVQRESSDTEEGRKIRQDYKQAIRKWKNCLTNFVTYYQPLECRVKRTFGARTSFRLFIQTEIGYGNYLPHLKHQLHDNNNRIDSQQEHENIILRVEELADLYYHSLWNCFTNEEKYLLFDLAKDRFVNLRNTKVIRILMQKGVIKANDSLQIMNQSFNNFILSAVNGDDEIRMEREQEQKGAWNTVYVVLIIVFLGLITFVALAQQKLFQNFSILIGAISSAIALLSRFGGLFGATTKAKE
jgi:hypothetical protein